jgi:hypothetical protein
VDGPEAGDRSPESAVDCDCASGLVSSLVISVKLIFSSANPGQRAARAVAAVASELNVTESAHAYVLACIRGACLTPSIISLCRHPRRLCGVDSAAPDARSRLFVTTTSRHVGAMRGMWPEPFDATRRLASTMTLLELSRESVPGERLN